MANADFRCPNNCSDEIYPKFALVNFGDDLVRDMVWQLTCGGCGLTMKSVAPQKNEES